MKVIADIIFGFVMWPLQALFAMLGFGILHHYEFPVPAPGYWSSFVIVAALELIKASCTLTAKVTEGSER